MTQNKEIIERIQELVPEIMELKEGCRLGFKYDDTGYAIVLQEPYNYDDNYTKNGKEYYTRVLKTQIVELLEPDTCPQCIEYYATQQFEDVIIAEAYNEEGEFNANDEFYNKYKILGRPITKFDVERAIYKYNSTKDYDTGFDGFDTLSSIYMNSPSIKDNLETQLENNPELSDFLFQIFNLNNNEQ